MHMSSVPCVYLLSASYSKGFVDQVNVHMPSMKVMRSMVFIQGPIAVAA